MIRRALAARGYELVPCSADRASFANFASLTAAYERRLNQGQPRIPPDDERPRLLGRLAGTPPPEAYCIIEALHATRDVAGDVCEFGVAQGETSALMANEMRPWPDKTLHLFDSFEGLPEPSAQDQLKDDVLGLGSIEAYAGTMAYPDDVVRRRLGAISFPAARVAIHKGFIESVLVHHDTLPERVSFAYVDFDFYEPIRVTLDFLTRVMAPGGMGAKTAVDEFVRQQNEGAHVFECEVPHPTDGHFVILKKVG
jgi:O-methyltransferase